MFYYWYHEYSQGCYASMLTVQLCVLRVQTQSNESWWGWGRSLVPVCFQLLDNNLHGLRTRCSVSRKHVLQECPTLLTCMEPDVNPQKTLDCYTATRRLNTLLGKPLSNCQPVFQTHDLEISKTISHPLNQLQISACTSFCRQMLTWLW